MKNKVKNDVPNAIKEKAEDALNELIDYPDEMFKLE